MESNRPTPEALRRAAVERVAYLLRLADDLEELAEEIRAEGWTCSTCRQAAHELRTIAEGTRVSPDAPMDPEGR